MWEVAPEHTAYRLQVVVIGAGAVTLTPNNSICLGSTDSLKATGGTAYSWLPTNGLNNPAIANPVATPTATTTYTVSITTTCGVVKDSVKVTVVPLPVVTLSAGSNPVCAGQSTNINATGGGTYSWSTGATTSSINVIPPSTTNYTLAVTNGGCKTDTNITITVTPLPVVTFTASVNPVCAGQPTTITATGGGTYLWNNASSSTSSSIIVTPSSTTTYSVLVTKNGCSNDTGYTVNVTPLPVVTITPDTAICTGGSATLNATGGGTYAWSPAVSTSSSISVTPSSTTTYSVTVTKNGCQKDTDVTVTVASTLTVNITGPKIICPGEMVTLKTTGGGSYSWSPGGATTDSINVNPVKLTNYSVTVKNGCTGTASTSVNVYNPAVIACCDTVIQSGNSAYLGIIGTDNRHYQWTPATGINCDTCANVIASPTVTTSYSVTITDSLGCLVQKIIVVTVDEPCFTDTIPNVFTPTNSGRFGLDNVFHINTSNLDSWSVFIYDRWGKEIFTTTSLNQYWNGETENGGQAPAGVYYYIINTTCNGTTTKRQGFVQLIR
jgi:gliding motility-associated-like protein